MEEVKWLDHLLRKEVLDEETKIILRNLKTKFRELQAENAQLKSHELLSGQVKSSVQNLEIIMTPWLKLNETFCYGNENIRDWVWSKCIIVIYNEANPWTSDVLSGKYQTIYKEFMKFQIWQNCDCSSWEVFQKQIKYWLIYIYIKSSILQCFQLLKPF